eukprot:2888133-Rhodomonas_salina.4
MVSPLPLSLPPSLAPSPPSSICLSLDSAPPSRTSLTLSLSPAMRAHALPLHTPLSLSLSPSTNFHCMLCVTLVRIGGGMGWQLLEYTTNYITLAPLFGLSQPLHVLKTRVLAPSSLLPLHSSLLPPHSSLLTLHSSLLPLLCSDACGVHPSA